MPEYRIEKDSMGEVRVPAEALYGAQTQRALENFTIKAPGFPRPFLRALGLLKAASATSNASLGLLDPALARAIELAALEVAEGKWDAQFPLVIYQTGSGTSTNMNANEVIAALAAKALGNKSKVHPNDHVNMCQSSNDMVPSAIHVSACFEVHERLLPALGHLKAAFEKRAAETHQIVKTGRTHLMDAMPLRLGQEIGAWAYQVQGCIERIGSAMPAMHALALGGTAVGTGVNAHKEFGPRAIAALSKRTGLPFIEAPNHFAAQGSMDAAANLSASLKTSATALMKIADDLRWMNSGPLAGLGEVELKPLQPGSSIMPGKVNPVICEAMMMVAARVIGNDLTVTLGNERGNFQLNVMLPVIASALLESIGLIADASELFADKAVLGFKVREARLAEQLWQNPILATALNPVIGYDRAAEVAKKAYAEGRSVLEVAVELTGMSEAELKKLMDPETAL